jgi:hypothetical protein
MLREFHPDLLSGEIKITRVGEGRRPEPGPERREAA